MKDNKTRLRRVQHTKKLFGQNLNRDRLLVFRTLNHIYAQIIEKNSGNILVAASSVELGKANDEISKIKQAEEVGKLIATKALKKNLLEVAFDRNGFRYHGRIKSLADAARSNGLKF